MRLFFDQADSTSKDHCNRTTCHWLKLNIYAEKAEHEETSEQEPEGAEDAKQAEPMVEKPEGGEPVVEIPRRGGGRDTIHARRNHALLRKCLLLQNLQMTTSKQNLQNPVRFFLIKQTQQLRML